MTSLLLMILAIIIFARAVNKVQAEQPKPVVVRSCPPHSWSWEKVYNDDGSLHHQHMVCKKCGPLHGVSNEQ